MSTEAGENSPFLDEREQRQASERAPIGPLVIHEIIREEGEAELERSFAGLSLSAFAAGLSIGFSFILQATMQAAMPDAPWRPLVASLGYTVGFLIVILGRQQLFTETTLTALIPTLTRRDRATLIRTLRVWAIVLVGNLLGAAVLGFVLARSAVMPPETRAAMDAIVRITLHLPALQLGIAAIGAGWLIGLTVWLLPGAGPARPLIIIVLTYAIAICRFPHVIAGSVELAYAVFSGQASLATYFLHFLLPAVIGNTIGGTALVALLNHAPIAAQLGHDSPA